MHGIVHFAKKKDVCLKGTAERKIRNRSTALWRKVVSFKTVAPM